MKYTKYFLVSLLGIITITVSSLYLFKTDQVPHGTKGKIPGAPAEDWSEKQRAFPYDEIPPNKYTEAINQVQQMPLYEHDSPLPWVLAGPTNIEGRITTIVINPANPQIVYAGTANGGIWKSTNFCQSWVSVFDNQNTSSIGALVIDPVNPNILYCGTGEDRKSVE